MTFQRRLIAPFNIQLYCHSPIKWPQTLRGFEGTPHWIKKLTMQTMQILFRVISRSSISACLDTLTSYGPTAGGGKVYKSDDFKETDQTQHLQKQSPSSLRWASLHMIWKRLYDVQGAFGLTLPLMLDTKHYQTLPCSTSKYVLLQADHLQQLNICSICEKHLTQKSRLAARARVLGSWLYSIWSSTWASNSSQQLSTALNRQKPHLIHEKLPWCLAGHGFLHMEKPHVPHKAIAERTINSIRKQSGKWSKQCLKGSTLHIMLTEKDSTDVRLNAKIKSWNLVQPELSSRHTLGLAPDV
jgi:hypothetical protein